MAVRARKTGIAAGLGAGKAVTPKAARARPSRRKGVRPPPPPPTAAAPLPPGAAAWSWTRSELSAGRRRADRPGGRAGGRASWELGGGRGKGGLSPPQRAWVGGGAGAAGARVRPLGA